MNEIIMISFFSVHGFNQKTLELVEFVNDRANLFD